MNGMYQNYTEAKDLLRQLNPSNAILILLERGNMQDG